MRIRTVIVDDEPLARALIRDLLSADPDVEVVAECADGKQALVAIDREAPALVFLDVQMPGISGLDVLHDLERAEMPYVIFVTAHDRYAIEAFEMQALDYLLKPFSRERFRESLERAKRSIRNRELAGLAEKMSGLAKSYAELKTAIDALEPGAPSYTDELRVREGRTLTRLSVSEIVWIEAADQYVRLHTARGSHLLSRSLTGLERELDPQRFCRIHRSTLVNTAFVREVRLEKNGACSVLVEGGRRLRLSRRRKAALDALLGPR